MDASRAALKADTTYDVFTKTRSAEKDTFVQIHVRVLRGSSCLRDKRLRI